MLTDGRETAAMMEKEGRTMSETKNSQVREAQDAWKKMIDDSIARFELGYGEVARLQEQAIEQQRHAIDEMAKLGKESLAYYSQLSAEWRKLSLEAAKRTAELVTFKV